MIDVVDQANRKICVTLLRYNVEKPEGSYARVRVIAKKKEDEKFQQTVYVNYKSGEFIYLLDVMNSVDEEVITNKPISNVLKKVFATIHFLSFLFLFESGWIGTLDTIGTY